MIQKGPLDVNKSARGPLNGITASSHGVLRHFIPIVTQVIIINTDGQGLKALASNKQKG